MSKSNSPQRQQANPLTKWLAMDWNRPERSYNPDVRDLLAGLLDYPKDHVVTEDAGGGGYPDIKLLTPEKIAWVVGDLKKEDAELTTESGRRNLWKQKRKYVEGLTRYVLFLTAHYLWLVLPTGETVAGFEDPCNLSKITFEELREKLQFLSYEQATHRNQWATLWGDQIHETFLAVTNIGLAPTATLITGENTAAVDSLIVALPKANLDPKTVVAYVNSKLARFYYLVRLRAGILEGSSRAHVYARTFEALPWVRTLDSSIEKRLVDGYNELARLAAIAKNNPNEWLLSEVETQIVTSRYKLSDRTLGLNFSNWSPEDVQVAELSLDENSIRAGLFSLELVDADVAELVYKLLTLNVDEETTISRGIIQKLLVPQDYAALMQAYRQRFDSFQQVESDFFAALAQIDQTVYEMFELTNAEKAHIETRLTSFPLNKLQPRYPWQTVKPRPIKAYTSDRFA